jgi:hypothetical protein
MFEVFCEYVIEEDWEVKDVQVREVSGMLPRMVTTGVQDNSGRRACEYLFQLKDFEKAQELKKKLEGVSGVRVSMRER